MKPRILITKQLDQQVLNYLSSFCDYTVSEKLPREDLIEQIGEYDGLLTTKVKVDDELLVKAHQLKIVSNIAVGYDNYDVQAIKKHRIMATHTPEVLDETVADLVFAIVLASARRISELDEYVKKGEWNKDDEESLFGKDVYGATMGIVGLGRIGQKVARRATLGFGMNVIYHNRTKNKEVEEDLGIRYEELDSLLKQSDFVVLMTPLTKETLHLIGKREFDLMKRDSIFINCARGQVIDQQALIKALKEKQIAGAGLDVFEKEPIDKDNELLKMKNVLTLPHIGSATKKTRLAMQMLAAENIVAGLTGNKPQNLISELKMDF
ncbi:2-hydroxyacid dehydrogenase [Halalkalibacter akibai]|uniref:Gluconate 2-dehydrogenase n=1 Tax=Halalkalibacter akibai (strain ATCC 43226 / DSM 21942 / CIP 109018 / JCM 9157 / 1139) TaxID=1236973 RepID=W4R016_HALA3|nr:D-glycerate dehydrogenase [Halalkalibacter akibai]GAE37482.1 gluconate 2-dehydrogenase [Halalkalibacter akibai JCM 9157]